MKNVFAVLKGSTPLETARNILASKFLPFLVAALELLFYYLGWEMATFYMLTALIVAMLVLLDDLTPLISVFLFMNVMISYQHSPSGIAGGSDFFFRTEVVVQLVILVVLIVSAFFVRLFAVAKDGKFAPSPVFFGLCFLAATFVLGGVGSSDYRFMDLAYGVIMAFFYLGIYTVIAANARHGEEAFERIGFAFIAFSAMLVIELAVKYITNFDAILAGGSINKVELTFGWGVWNSIGMWLSLCIPPMFLLAAKYKFGFGFIIYATVLLGAAFLTGSRQAMLGAGFAYLASSVAVLIKSKKRLYNVITLGVILLMAVIAVAVKWEKVASLFSKLMDNLWGEDGFTGNGRIPLIEKAMEYFASNPFFGRGFFSDYSISDPDFTNLAGLIPTFAHNTYAEMLGSCGILGILAYTLHRIQTIVAFANKPSFNKFYIGISIVAMLLMSLLDNHIFYILPTMVYSGLLVYATGEDGAEGRCMLKSFARKTAGAVK